MQTCELLKPFGVDIDLEQGFMINPAHTLTRKASSMKGLYADTKALERLIENGGDPLHYQVFETPVPEEQGHLMYCISTLQPGRVGDEYFMTKGHYHSVRNTAEIYLALRGQGFMLLKTPEGECIAEPMHRGRMVYVPPYWGHRSVNTGAEPLISFCSYPAEAGHNYGDIETEGFPKRIVERGGKPALI